MTLCTDSAVTHQGVFYPVNHQTTEGTSVTHHYYKVN